MAGDREKAPAVLVIDDDRGIRSLLSVALSEAGWNVVEASNGFTGLRLADQETPDLILLDLALPEVGGIAVLDELRRQPATRAIPVVAVTGHPDWLAGRQETVSGVLSKPFGLDDAVAMAAQALARSRRPTAPIPPATTGLHDRFLAAPTRASAPPLSERA